MTDPRKIIERLANLPMIGHEKELTGLVAAARAFLAEPETEVVVEHAALHELVLWAYSKLHAREFTRLEDALELDRMKLYVEHRVIA